MAEQKTSVNVEVTLDQLRATIDDAIGNFSRFKVASLDVFATVNRSATTATAAFQNFNKAAIVDTALSSKLDEHIRGFNRFSYSAGEMQRSVTGAFQKITGALTPLNILMGTAFVASLTAAVTKTSQLIYNSELLAQRLGTSASEASILSTALGDIYTDTETYTQALTFLTRQLRRNEEDLKLYGLRTRDVNGNLRDSQEVFKDALNIVKEYKPGLDQTSAAMAFFSRSVGEVFKLMKLTNEVMDEARRKHEELGLTVTQKNVAANQEYMRTMNDAEDVLRAFGKVIGDLLIPIVTRLGQWFIAAGPGWVSSFRLAMATLVSVLHGVVFAFELVGNVATAVLTTIINAWAGAGDFFKHILEGDFAGAVRVASVASQNAKEAWTRALDNIGESAKKTKASIQEAFNPDQTKTETAKGGGKAAPGDRSGMVSQLEERLAQMKAMEEKAALDRGQFQAFTLAMERDYWAEVLRTVQLTKDERIKVLRKYWELEIKIGREAFDAQLEDLRNQQNAFRNNLAERLRIAQEIANRVSAAFGSASPEAKRAMQDVIALQRESTARSLEEYRIYTESVAELRLKDLDILKSQIDGEFNLRERSQAQVLELYRDIEEQKYQIRKTALEREIALEEQNPDRNTAKLAQLYAQRLSMAKEHELAILELKKQSAQEAAKYAVQAQDSVKDNFAVLVKDIVEGHKTIKESVLDFVDAIQSAIIRLGAQRIAESVMGPGTAGGNFLGSIFKGVFPGMEFGGNVFPGQAYRINERFGQQEVFVPATTGRITNGQGGGASVVQHNHFHISGAMDRRSQEQIAAAAATGANRAARRLS